MALRKAARKKARIRLGMSGPSGFGKTYSALLIAKGIAGSWDKVAIIDTENRSADLYADLGDFNVFELPAPYPPEKYIAAIAECEQAGMEVIIIDSISHEWDGKGGCLEIVEKLGGKYQDWAKVTPRHQAFIDAIVRSSCHIITTVRRKQDYEMTKGNDGKIKVEKAGLREITREGFEYELTVNLEFLNDNHYVKAGKDRTGLFMNRPEFVPDEGTGKLILNWCEQGEIDNDVPHYWYEGIENCQTKKELSQYYEAHKADIDIDPRIQKIMKNHQAKLNSQSTITSHEFH